MVILDGIPEETPLRKIMKIILLKFTAEIPLRPFEGISGEICKKKYMDKNAFLFEESLKEYLLQSFLKKKWEYFFYKKKKKK